MIALTIIALTIIALTIIALTIIALTIIALTIIALTIIALTIIALTIIALTIIALTIIALTIIALTIIAVNRSINQFTGTSYFKTLHRFFWLISFDVYISYTIRESMPGSGYNPTFNVILSSPVQYIISHISQ
ncbi:hypothetical protein RSJ42_01710 [Methanosarcina hadiensis]|uniref:hypothetical protein n=1 Tax=Methanosarcina hadiensis TaxID=3078083 RepID=UPI0039776B0A